MVLQALKEVVVCPLLKNLEILLVHSCMKSKWQLWSDCLWFPFLGRKALFIIYSCLKHLDFYNALYMGLFLKISRRCS